MTPRRPAPRRCRGPRCRKVIPWHEGMKPSEYERLETCGRVCGLRLGHTRRAGYIAPAPHRCKLAECDEVVPMVAGETPARYRRREYHADECRQIGRGRTASRRHRTRAPWLDEVRPCARVGCEETFAPRREGQRYHDHACSVLARSRGRQRETKLCECGCGSVFERPAGLSRAEWQTRRFASGEHYRASMRGRSRSPLANGEPGAARAGRRVAPSVAPSRDRRPAQPAATAPRPVFPEGPRAEPFRPGRLPERVPVPPATSRPSFGLTRARRSA